MIEKLMYLLGYVPIGSDEIDYQSEACEDRDALEIAYLTLQEDMETAVSHLTAVLDDATTLEDILRSDQ